MAKLRSGEVQINVALPQSVIDAVIDYQFSNRLQYQKDAYRELLEKGLQKDAEERASKS